MTDDPAKDPETGRQLAELAAEVATLVAALAKLRADVDMLLAAREEKDREALARPLPPLPSRPPLWGDVAELRDEIRAGFAEILRKLESR